MRYIGAALDNFYTISTHFLLIFYSFSTHWDAKKYTPIMALCHKQECIPDPYMLFLPYSLTLMHKFQKLHPILHAQLAIYVIDVLFRRIGTDK